MINTQFPFHIHSPSNDRRKNQWGEQPSPLMSNISNLDQSVQLPLSPNDGHPGGDKKDKRQFREKRETPQGSGDSPEGGRDNFVSRTSPCVTRTLRISHFPQTFNLELGEESRVGEGELATSSLKEWVNPPCSCFLNIHIFIIFYIFKICMIILLCVWRYVPASLFLFSPSHSSSKKKKTW